MDACPCDPSKPSAFAVGMLREKKRIRTPAELAAALSRERARLAAEHDSALADEVRMRHAAEAEAARYKAEAEAAAVTAAHGMAGAAERVGLKGDGQKSRGGRAQVKQHEAEAEDALRGMLHACRYQSTRVL